MIKARAGDLVILGLSEDNVTRLRQGQPIVFDGAQIGLDGNRILIMYGETEEAIAATLEQSLPRGSVQ